MTDPVLSQILARSRAAGRTLLDEPAAKRALASIGLAVPRGVTVEPGASPALEGLRGPFAVKLISPDASHKSDIGGVRLGLADAPAAVQAVRDMEALARAKGLSLDGVLVEEMSPSGIELAVGGVIDARFGPVIMLGLGGVFVELFGDIAFRVCPIDRQDAGEMIDELRGAPLLRGFRGRPPVDERRIIDVLLKLSAMLAEFEGEIAELDVNPLIVSADSAIACDARIVLTGR